MSANRENTKNGNDSAQEMKERAIQSKVEISGTQPAVSNRPESAEEKIARLEKELREVKLRADFYDEMINVAEKKFDIQIRKKAGARQ